MAEPLGGGHLLEPAPPRRAVLRRRDGRGHAHRGLALEEALHLARERRGALVRARRRAAPPVDDGRRPRPPQDLGAPGRRPQSVVRHERLERRVGLAQLPPPLAGAGRPRPRPRRRRRGLAAPARVVDVRGARPVRRRAARPAAPRPAPRRAVVRVADLGRRRRLRPRDGRRDLARRPPEGRLARARRGGPAREQQAVGVSLERRRARGLHALRAGRAAARRVAQRRPAAHGLLVDAVAHELDLAAVQVLRVLLERALAAAHLAVVGQARVGLVLHACCFCLILPLCRCRGRLEGPRMQAAASPALRCLVCAGAAPLGRQEPPTLPNAARGRPAG